MARTKRRDIMVTYDYYGTGVQKSAKEIIAIFKNYGFKAVTEEIVTEDGEKELVVIVRKFHTPKTYEFRLVKDKETGKYFFFHRGISEWTVYGGEYELLAICSVWLNLGMVIRKTQTWFPQHPQPVPWKDRQRKGE